MVFRQFIRYAIVGCVSNAVLYGVYLLETRLGLGPALAATIVYALGVLQTFLLNRRWTFNYEGLVGPSFRRYVVAYAVGYTLNISGLIALIDWGGLPHQIAEGIMIVVVAVLVFALQKWWVFQPRSSDANHLGNLEMTKGRSP